MISRKYRHGRRQRERGEEIGKKKEAREGKTPLSHRGGANKQMTYSRMERRARKATISLDSRTILSICDNREGINIR